MKFIGKSGKTIVEHLQDMLNEPALFAEMTGYQTDAVREAIKTLAEGDDALRVEEKEASIVMKTRHAFRSPDYERPYCGACNHYVPDANAAFCCWCGARFVTPIPPLPEVTM